MKGYKLPIVKIPRQHITAWLPHFRHRAAMCVIFIHLLACSVLNYFVITTFHQGNETQEHQYLESIAEFYRTHPLMDKYGLMADGHSLWSAISQTFPNIDRIDLLNDLGIAITCAGREADDQPIQPLAQCKNTPPPSLNNRTRYWENSKNHSILWQSLHSSNSAPYWLKLEIRHTPPILPNNFLTLLLITEFIIGSLFVAIVYYIAQHLERNVDILAQRIQLFEYSQFKDATRTSQHELPWVLSDIEHTLHSVLDRVKQEVTRLHLKETLLENMQRHLNGIIVLCDEHGTISSISRPLQTLITENITGKHPYHPIGERTLSEWIHPASLSTYQETFQRAYKQLSAASCHVEFKLGEITIPVEIQFTTLPESPESPLSILAYIYNRSEQHKEQETLKKQLRHHLDWLEYLPLPLYIKDHTGHYIFFNQAWENITQTPRTELLGKTAWDVFEADCAQELWDKERHTLETKTITVDETFVRSMKGQTRRALVYRAPLVTHENKTNILGLIVSLDGHVHHTDLEARLHLAEKQDHQHTQMLAHLSKEVRSYLHNLLGLIDLMNASLKTLALPHTNEYISLIHSLSHEVLSSTTDVNDILSFEQGTLVPHIESFDIESVLIECMRHFGSQAESKHLELIVSTDPQLPIVEGDPHLLRRALDLLIHNAIKYTSAGSVELHATLLGIEYDRASLRFKVQDTGVGIPKDQHTHIFEPFVQGDASLGQHTRSGAGLGLTVFSRLMKYAGFSYQIDSTPRHGTCISFDWTFPCLPSPSTPEIEVLQNKTLLIVESHTKARHTIRNIVQHWNIHTLEAQNIDQALSFLDDISSNSAIHAILIDGRLSEEDRSAPYRILEMAYKANIPQRLIMLPVNAPFREHERYRQSHATAILLKPIYRVELLNALTLDEPYLTITPHTKLSHPLRSLPQPALTLLEKTKEKSTVRTLLATHDPINRKLLQGWLEQLGHRCISVGTTEELLSYYTSEKFDALFIDLDMTRPSGAELIQLICLQNRTLSLKTPIIGMLSGKIEAYFIPENTSIFSYIQKPVQQHALSTILDSLDSTPTASSHPSFS